MAVCSSETGEGGMKLDLSGISLYRSLDAWEAHFYVPRQRDSLTVVVSGDEVEIDGLAYEGDTCVRLQRTMLHAAFGALALAEDWTEVPQESPLRALCAYTSKSRPLGIDYDWYRNKPPTDRSAWFYTIVVLPQGGRTTNHRTLIEAIQAAQEMAG